MIIRKTVGIWTDSFQFSLTVEKLKPQEFLFFLLEPHLQNLCPMLPEGVGFVQKKTEGN